MQFKSILNQISGEHALVKPGDILGVGDISLVASSDKIMMQFKRDSSIVYILLGEEDSATIAREINEWLEDKKSTERAGDHR